MLGSFAGERPHFLHEKLSRLSIVHRRRKLIPLGVLFILTSFGVAVESVSAQRNVLFLHELQVLNLAVCLSRYQAKHFSLTHGRVYAKYTKVARFRSRHKRTLAYLCLAGLLAYLAWHLTPKIIDILTSEQATAEPARP